MEAKLTREQANELLHKYVKGENYITHSYAVEAIMRGLAKKLAPEDVEYWGICGLLHDLDEETAPWRDDFGTHGPTSAKILRDEGFGDPVMENAITIAKINAVIFLIIKTPFKDYSLPSRMETPKPAANVTAVTIYAVKGTAPL